MIQPYKGIDTAQLLVSAMKVTRMNHRIIANNIANVDTPHFNQVDLDFEKTLDAVLEGRDRVSLRKTRVKHFDFQGQRPRFNEASVLSKNDFNKVDLDDQMSKLTKNAGDYGMYAQLLNKRFDQVQNMLQALRQ